LARKQLFFQAEASACISGLANVLFCEWVVHYFVFLLVAKLSVGSVFFTLGGNGKPGRAHEVGVVWVMLPAVFILNLFLKPICISLIS